MHQGSEGEHSLVFQHMQQVSPRLQKESGISSGQTRVVSDTSGHSRTSGGEPASGSPTSGGGGASGPASEDTSTAGDSPAISCRSEPPPTSLSPRPTIVARVSPQAAPMRAGTRTFKIVCYKTVELVVGLKDPVLVSVEVGTFL